MDKTSNTTLKDKDVINATTETPKFVIKKVTKQEVDKAESAKLPKATEEVLYNDAYVSSFENLTIKDIKRQEDEIAKEEFKTVKAELIKQEQELIVSQTVESATSTKPERIEVKSKKLIIEKPNYDLLDVKENVQKTKNKKIKNWKKVALVCSFAFVSIGCVTNCVLIDNLSSQFIAVEDSYNLNLLKYLRNINNLNATNKSLELFETYPEDLNPPSSLGQSTNWFDTLANFITRVFGG